MMLLIIIGCILILLAIFLSVLVFMNVKKNYEDRKKLGFKKQAFNSTVSLILVIVSFIFLGTAIYNLSNSNNASQEGTIYLAISSMFLTIGFASLVYFEQYIENQITTKKIESLVSDLLSSLQKTSSSDLQKTDYDECLGTSNEKDDSEPINQQKIN